ncbi:MAG: carbohydrate kinase family protein [Rhizobiaceae bacterium]|nr:carbohydrate kinase family protein [Rhizobiaceae bacterium]
MNDKAGKSGIITGGSWCADHNRLVERWPEEESLVKIISDEFRGGGSACNLAIDIKRLDPNLPVSTIGLLGDDADGHALRKQAETEGLDCSLLATHAGQQTSFTDAYTSQDTTRRTHLFYAGTSDHLTPDHFDFTHVDAKILHLGLPGLHNLLDGEWNGDENGWVTVLRKAQSKGLKTNLELCSLPPEMLKELVTPCLQQLNYLIINEYEIAAVAGNPVGHDGDTDIETCISNARHVISNSPLELVIVHFPGGAVAITRQGEVEHHASVNVPPDQIAGTNGAGDAFAAGALYGLHEGWPLHQTLQLAHASAAASIRHIGTTDAVVGWAECLELASQHGWRDLQN